MMLEKIDSSDPEAGNVYQSLETRISTSFVLALLLRLSCCG
eukprot:SAG31_NODE_3937_length_3736_cov_1.195766_3_plen_41_part_00